ncbi:MAG: hypothetical protein IJ766_00950 [Clostridia bacterium]|nr:hypothetical protein [Clostridia bacterium]
MSKKNLFSRIYEKIPDSKKELVNFYAAVTGILAFVGNIGQIVVWLIKNIKSSISNNVIPWVLFFVVLIILSILIIIFIKKVRQYKNSLWNRKTVVIKQYEKLLSGYLEFYFELLKLHKNNDLSIDVLNSTVRSFTIKLLDSICEIYSIYTGAEIHACIKTIGTEKDDFDYENDNIDTNSAIINTFVRSSDTQIERTHISSNPVLLKGNTDFLSILESKNPCNPYNYFYVRDLEKYKNDLEKRNLRYDNTTVNYLSYYRGVIVTPIMIRHSKLHFTNTEDEHEYHVLGFLCIDTMSTNAFIDENKTPFIQLAMSFSEIAYLTLNKYKFYYSRLIKEGKNDDKQ